jgi:hypothetical protein
MRVIMYVHRRGLNTQFKTIRSYLLNRDWPLRRAAWLSTEYRHLAELRALSDEQCHNDVH